MCLLCVDGRFSKIQSHISEHLEMYNVYVKINIMISILTESRETQLTTTINDFAECLNQGGQCDVIFLDFSKSLKNSRLCRKRYHYGIHGALLSWLQAFLQNRSQ